MLRLIEKKNRVRKNVESCNRVKKHSEREREREQEQEEKRKHYQRREGIGKVASRCEREKHTVG